MGMMPYSTFIYQMLGQPLEEIAQQVAHSGFPPNEIGVLLYRTGAVSFNMPISGEVVVAIVALREAGLL